MTFCNKGSKLPLTSVFRVSATSSSVTFRKVGGIALVRSPHSGHRLGST